MQLALRIQIITFKPILTTFEAKKVAFFEAVCGSSKNDLKPKTKPPSANLKLSKSAKGSVETKYRPKRLN